MAIAELNQRTRVLLQDLNLPKDISAYSADDLQKAIEGKSFSMSREQLKRLTNGLSSRDDTKKAYARFTAAYLLWLNKRVSNEEVQVGCRSIVAVSQRVAPATSDTEDKTIRGSNIQGKWIDSFRNLFSVFPSMSREEIGQLQIHFGAIYFSDTCPRGNALISERISPEWSSVASTLLTCVQTPNSCEK